MTNGAMAVTIKSAQAASQALSIRYSNRLLTNCGRDVTDGNYALGTAVAGGAIVAALLGMLVKKNVLTLTDAREVLQIAISAAPHMPRPRETKPPRLSPACWVVASPSVADSQALKKVSAMSGSSPSQFTDETAASDFSHPISHRTPHYRVGNGEIRRMVISQKRLNFLTKWNYTIQDNTGGNGLGNRCPIQPGGEDFGKVS
jgi:hypothetical protein